MNIKVAKSWKLSRRMKFRGLDISVETDEGEIRHWYDPHNEEKGKTKMRHPYGYIRRTKGVDGDHVDVYVGPHEDAKNVYVIHQMKAPEFKKYDEDKCMLGFRSAEAAKAAYLNHYNDTRFFGSMTTMPFEEFEKKVKHSFDLKRPHKIAADFTIPLPSNVAIESAASPVAEQALGTLGTVGTVAAVPAAGVWYGARRAEQALPQYKLVEPALTETAKKFTRLADSPGVSAGEFVRKYIQHGSELAGAPAMRLPSGEVLTGAELNKRIRGRGITGRISELLTQKPFTRQSALHYKAFEKGVIPAYAQMAQEAYEHGIKAPRAAGGEHVFKGKRGLLHDFTTTVGEARYEAAKALADKGKLHPTRFRQALVEVMRRKMPNVPSTDVTQFVKSLEGQLLEASPKTYTAHLEAIRAGQDATQLQNKLLSQAGLKADGSSAHAVMKRMRRLAKQQGLTGPFGKMAPETQRKLFEQVAKADDPVLQLLNMRIREGWKAAPSQYGTMIEPLLQYQKAHGQASKLVSRLRRGGKAALIAGGGLAALPFLTKLFGSPERSQIKISNIAEDRMSVAYKLGCHAAASVFSPTVKHAAALGDPAFWQGGTPPPGAEGAMPPAQTAEEAVQLLPAGTFQGAQIKIQPDGQRSTTVKVTPDAVAQPDALANVFAAEPAAKVEISQPEQKGEGGAGEELVPPELATSAGKMAALRDMGLQ